MSGLPRSQDPDAVLAEGGDLDADPGEDLVGRPAGLGLDHVRLVLVGEQVRRPVDQVADQLAVAERELLARVGDERVPALTALVGVADHALGVVGRDQHERRVAHPVDDRLELDQPGLAHGAGVERRELRHRGVGGAHEPRGVTGLGDAHRRAVDAVPLQPGAVVGEVVAGRPDQHRRDAEGAEAEAHVRRDATAPDLQLVDEEGDRELVELLDDEGVAELAAERHQVVSGDGSADQQGHVAAAYRRKARSPSCWAYPSVAPTVETWPPTHLLGPPATCTPTRAPPATTCGWSAPYAGSPSRPRACSTTTSRARCRSGRSASSEAAQRLANALHLHLD